MRTVGTRFFSSPSCAWGILACALVAACSDTTTGSTADAAADVAAKDVVRDTPSIDTPLTDTPVTDVPVTDVPVTDTPIADTPVTDTPVTDVPVTDTPVTDAPVTDVPFDVARDAPVCTTGLTMCPSDGGFVCVDTNSDRNNCGGCGRTCCAGSACFSGSCPLGCAAGTTRCGCICTNLQNDTSNCGMCGNPCPAGAFCTAGMCVRPDAGTGCATVTEPPAPSGQCDGRGRIACQNWASGMLDAGTAFATCVSTPAGCMRADSCSDFADPSTCRCGAGAACAPGQVCSTRAGETTPSCHCIAQP
ncbi:MAG: hypothetical protein U0326_44620 [Polyangiales bacterium]